MRVSSGCSVDSAQSSQTMPWSPLYCTRLMGYPAEWLKGIEGRSDAKAYRALCNSLAVPCVEWIFGDCSIFTASTAAQAVTNAPTPGPEKTAVWVSIGERRPLEHGRYVVLFAVTDEPAALDACGMTWLGDWQEHDARWRFGNAITHWAELPEPPALGPKKIKV